MYMYMYMYICRYHKVALMGPTPLLIPYSGVAKNRVAYVAPLKKPTSGHNFKWF